MAQEQADAPSRYRIRYSGKQAAIQSLASEFPEDQASVESVVKTYRGEPTTTLRRRVKDVVFGHSSDPIDEFQNLKSVYRDYMQLFRVSCCLEHCERLDCMAYHPAMGELRRRRPERLSNGIWNYLPVRCLEENCRETSCSFSHIFSEIIFHPMTYKTQQCEFALNDEQQCIRYGIHCPYIHPEIDGDGLTGLPFNRNRPTESMPGLNSLQEQREYSEQVRALFDTFVDPPPSRVNKILKQRVEPTNNDQAFTRETYKTKACCNPTCNKSEKCVYYHCFEERRREDDSLYSQQPCGFTYDNTEKRFLAPGRCPDGDSCPYSHSENEVFFHRQMYHKKPCLNLLQKSSCPHLYCPFLHQRNQNPQLPSVVVQEEEKLQPPAIDSSVAEKAAKAREEVMRLSVFVIAAEHELRRLEADKKCSVCARSEQFYVLACGHALCEECAADLLRQKAYMCRKCGKVSKHLVRFSSS